METYKIRRISSTRKSGITAPALCTLGATLKFDGEEAPHCVYNEYVALRLAQTLHVPVADGVLTSTGDGPTYASLMLHSPGINLPDVLENQLDSVAQRYPQRVAALLAYDLFIGNGDRARNLKAALVTPHVRFFAAFDHSHALLGVESNPTNSIRKLAEGELIVRRHPFYGRVQAVFLEGWISRIVALPDGYIRECCGMGKPFRAVSEELQQFLADAMIKRKAALPAIVQGYASFIRSRP
ncbi:hypothetical protein [Acidithiobacillus thiooxidans]|uniref:hypothetical protein n=1 Tax=Acidithiobacillus thiooxidans TaxID=930 RepID=UPI00129E5630|nr:hypothetical protein [Acidithiobacillus thiooxidans]MDA8154750.1 hypothetical protein [Acidithiobacillus sp.]